MPVPAFVINAHLHESYHTEMRKTVVILYFIIFMESKGRPNWKCLSDVCSKRQIVVVVLCILLGNKKN